MPRILRDGHLLLRGKDDLHLFPLLRISRRPLRDIDLPCFLGSPFGIILREEVTAKEDRKMPEARLLENTNPEVAFGIVGLPYVAWNSHWDADQS